MSKIEGMTPTIEAVGYGISGDIGGIQKKTYYTPDGRKMLAVPNIREYVVKDANGKVKGSGTRDGNYDRGWLETMPQVKKPYCKGCDRWHDTQKEVTDCIKKQTAYLSRMEALAKKETKKKETNLEKKVADLTAMVEKLLKAQKNG